MIYAILNSINIGYIRAPLVVTSKIVFRRHVHLSRHGWYVAEMPIPRNALPSLGPGTTPSCLLRHPCEHAVLTNGDG
jgi:hypothetical protein